MMRYIDIPYLPREKTALAISDVPIDGVVTIAPPEINRLPISMRCHADLGIFVVDKTTVICPPDTFSRYKEKLSPHGFNVLCGKTPVGSSYPGDSAYNAAIVGHFCFLNKKVCDMLLLECVQKAGYEIINVKQGYTKCSICPVTENALVTSDAGICKAAKNAGLDVFLVDNKSIVLQGFDCGFFGGCASMLDRCTMAVNGNAERLGNFVGLSEFVGKYGVKIKSLHQGEIKDIGSIIPLKTKQ